VTTLFKQHYSECIIAQCNGNLSQNSALEPLSAYNRTVQMELERFKDTNPQEFEGLENAVLAIEAAANVDFDCQSPEVQQA
jgi:hypothetical protein